MFSRRDQLIQKTGEFGIGRYDFLRQLIHEYTTTTSYECKKQTLSNLANFAYDPINYEFMKQLHLNDLFLAEIQNENEELVLFAIAGLCNLACDPETKEYIISLNGIKLISNLLLHKNIEISLNALTTLYYLFESKNVAVPQELREKVAGYENSNNPRLKNLGNYFYKLTSMMFLERAFRRPFSDGISYMKGIFVGQEVTITRAITKEDVDKYTELSGDTNPVHSSEFAIVHGAFLNSLVSSVIGTRLPGPGTLVVQQTLNFPNKCYVGETVDVKVKVVDVRKIVKVDFSCDVQEKTVLYGSAKLKVPT